MSEETSSPIQEAPAKPGPPLRTAQKILAAIASNTLPRGKLTPYQRLVCVKFFVDEHPEYTDNQIAQALRCSRQTVATHRKRVFEHEARWLQKLDPYHEAAELKSSTRARIAKVQKLAVEAKDPREAGMLWERAHRMEMDLYGKLFELGILTQAPKKFAVDLTQDQKVTLSLITEMAFARPKPSVKREDDVGILGRNGGEVAGASQN